MKYVRFRNELFHRDRPHLLQEIKRANSRGQDKYKQEIIMLETKVVCLEQKIQMITQDFNYQFEAFKNEMLSRCTNIYSSGLQVIPNAHACQTDAQYIHPNDQTQHTSLGRVCSEKKTLTEDDLDWGEMNRDLDSNFDALLIDQDSSVLQPPTIEVHSCNEVSSNKDFNSEPLDSGLLEIDASLQAILYPSSAQAA